MRSASRSFAEAPSRYQPALDAAFSSLYSSQFVTAQKVLDGYLTQHPENAVGFSVRASRYLFAELDRLGILEADFFKDDKSITNKKKSLQPDPRIHDLFYAAVNQAQNVSRQLLARNANHQNALFATCLADGVLTDYLALIEKRQMQSLSVNKDGYRDPKRRLKPAPDFYDAYTHHRLHRIPHPERSHHVSLVRALRQGAGRQAAGRANHETGARRLPQISPTRQMAQNGHYPRPFAKILLATAYLRDKRYLKGHRMAVVNEVSVQIFDFDARTITYLYQANKKYRADRRGGGPNSRGSPTWRAVGPMWRDVRSPKPLRPSVGEGEWLTYRAYRAFRAPLK